MKTRDGGDVKIDLPETVNVNATKAFTMADIKGAGAIQQMWITPTGHWRFLVLRIYWDDEKEPSVEVPVGDFFGAGSPQTLAHGALGFAAAASLAAG